jgi:hypothetical protein
MSEPHWTGRAALLPTGDVLVTGGDDWSGSLFTATRWIAATGTWVPAPPMAVPRDRHTMTPLPNGKILVAGTTGTASQGANAEVYDASSDTWSCAGTMIAPRFEHTATLLSDGTVLFAGGVSDGVQTTTAEIFDPSDPTSCAPTNDCAGGYLVDGVCCDAACDGQCMACTQARGAVADGVCTLLSDVPCDLGNACSQNDTCSAGICLSGSFDPMCPPPGECKFGLPECDFQLGCPTFPQPDGTPCANGTCLSGTCVPASTGDGGAGGAGGHDDDDDDDQGEDGSGHHHHGH